MQLCAILSRHAYSCIYISNTITIFTYRTSNDKKRLKQVYLKHNQFGWGARSSTSAGDWLSNSTKLF